MTSSETSAGHGFQPWSHMGATNTSEQTAAPPADEVQPQPPTAEELQALREAAYEEGLRVGREEGLQQGAAEIAAQSGRLRALIDVLARPLEQLDSRVEDELVALCIALVRQLVRREIKTDPGVIVAAIREAIAVLPLAAREVAVKVHPEDAALLRELYSEAEDQRPCGWQIVETPAITRGGCVVVASSSEVDATVERRLANAICHVFGGERAADLATKSKTPERGAAGAGE